MEHGLRDEWIVGALDSQKREYRLDHDKRSEKI
jgi:hypothetical protein